MSVWDVIISVFFLARQRRSVVIALSLLAYAAFIVALGGVAHCTEELCDELADGGGR